jgi:hypothetical protein
MDLKKIRREGMGWINLAQDRENQLALVYMVMKLLGSIICREFFDKLRLCKFLKMDSALYN